MTKIKVFVVDDDNLTIDLLIRPLQDSGKIYFQGRANSGEECLRRLKNQPVDIVLMDINMPGIDGLETARALLQQKQEDSPKIIFLTVFGDYSYVYKAVELRASLIGKNIGIDDLVSTICRVHEGELIINPNPNGLIREDSNAKLQMVLQDLLSEEQLQIACAIRDGKTSEQIADMLDDKNATYVNNQRKEIFRRLRRLKPEINAASLGAIMERSGLCPSLELGDLDDFLPRI